MAAIAAITRDLNERGVPAPASERWRPGGVRSVARRVKNAGLRVHRGRVVGEGPWEALVTEAEHQAAVAVLSDPRRRTQRGTTPTHLLSGIAVCGVCGGPLRAATVRGRAAYVCRGGFCVSRGQADLDDYVTDLVVARLGREGDLGTSGGGEHLAALRERQEGLLRLFAVGQISEAAAREAMEAVEAQIRAVRDRQAGAAVLGPLLAAGDVRGAWEALPVGRRRRVVSVLFSRIALNPTGTGRRTPVHEVVEVVWA